MSCIQANPDEAEPPTIIKEFMQGYNAQGNSNKNYEYYKILAEHTAVSLERKLIERHSRKAYESEDDIRNDIVDFSGVRIALFFPHHKARVNSFLEKTYDFDPENPKDKIEHQEKASRTQPAKKAERDQSTLGDPRSSQYSRRFKGYQATHYRVRFKKGAVPMNFREDDKVKIQVMTVLQSAWSEVEHNILYKKLKGSPSFPERQMLDGLSGLVSVGELYLDQLNGIFEDRIASDQDQQAQFANQYELGAFLSLKMHDQRSDEFDISCVELLRKFLRLDGVAANSKQTLNAKLSEVDFSKGVRESPRNPYSIKPNASLLIMEQLYYSSEELQRRADSFKPGTDADYCKVLISAIISLDELFAPAAFWGNELMGAESSYTNHVEKSRLKSLAWLMGAQITKSLLIGDGQPLKPVGKNCLLDIWKWLGEHESPCVQFVMSISRLGVLRDFPREIVTVERLCAWRGKRLINLNLQLI
ncbi:uncharacterized protein K452DRAFT_334670 [Neofusicoccum parvum]|uniref:Uncharacterized protein K452DRAFT_334670 n=1 Tax=Neofusicoccum parvum TaxID=310453 RepID=A0ACB5RVS1_9PEZI|nr:uncharacterized protein K452DRAFT_334670 [Neofusicoccum parvum]